MLLWRRSSPSSPDPSTTRRRRTRRRRPCPPPAVRTLGPLAAVALIAVIGAGCSNPSGAAAPAARGGGTGGTGGSLSQGVKFAHCMRSNGVGNFPDPDASGQFTIDAIANGSGVDTNSAAFQQALNACKALEPAGFTGSARSAQQQEAALKFAQCVRDNGVSDFPDPTAGSPLVDTNRIPSANTPGGMSVLNAAMQKCRSFSGAAGVTGGR